MDVLSPHLRGIVIAGGLSIVALGLGFMTLAMNHASTSSPHVVLSLKARHLAGRAPTKPKRVEHKTVDANFVAALKGGLPRSIARGLAAHRVTVVALTSSTDTVAALAAHETEAGARLAGASFVRVSVDRDGGDASALTALIGNLPAAPATLVYVRPATLYAQIPGFNDKTTVQQAARNALRAPAGTSTTPAPTATAPATIPAATTPPATPAPA